MATPAFNDAPSRAHYRETLHFPLGSVAFFVPLGRRSDAPFFRPPQFARNNQPRIADSVRNDFLSRGNMATWKRQGKFSETRSEDEWIGGIITPEGRILRDCAGDADAFLMWLGPNNSLRGLDVGKPRELVLRAFRSLTSAFECPVEGQPERARRLRVASVDLVTALAKEALETTVVCGPVPELTSYAQGWLNGLSAELRLPKVPDVPFFRGIQTTFAEQLFRDAASLFRAKPWVRLRGPYSVLAFASPQLGLTNAVVALRGDEERSVGFLLFSNLEEYHGYLRDDDGEPARALLAFVYERGAEMPADYRKSVARHRWELASARAYPDVIAFEREEIRPVTEMDLTVAHLVILALLTVLGATTDGATPFDLVAAVEADRELSLSGKARTFAGPREWTLSLPHPSSPQGPAADAVLAGLREHGKKEANAMTMATLEEELMQQFETSRDGLWLRNARWADMLLAEAFFVGASVATLTPSELETIVFERLPKSSGLHPSQAEELLVVFRAFFAFLGRDCGFSGADAFTKVLAGAPVSRLRSAFERHTAT